MIKIGANFLFWLSSQSMLHFKGSYIPKVHRSRPETLIFTEGSAGHNIFTPYRGLMQYLHIMMITVGLILLF